MFRLPRPCCWLYIFSLFFWGEYRNIPLPWVVEDFDAATADEQLWVAECDGQPVGFAAVWTADNFLHHLFVDPDWQGKHIGSALLAQVERTFTASGTLKCLMENKNALRFYQRHGWTIEAQGASPEGRYWLMRSPRP